MRCWHNVNFEPHLHAGCFDISLRKVSFVNLNLIWIDMWIVYWQKMWFIWLSANSCHKFTFSITNYDCFLLNCFTEPWIDAFCNMKGGLPSLAISHSRKQVGAKLNKTLKSIPNMNESIAYCLTNGPAIRERKIEFFQTLPTPTKYLLTRKTRNVGIIPNLHGLGLCLIEYGGWP